LKAAEPSASHFLIAALIQFIGITSDRGQFLADGGEKFAVRTVD
jgi:hypothetical protein